KAGRLQTVRNPDLDDRLTGDAEPSSLSVKTLNHPHRKVYVCPTLLECRATSLIHVQGGRDVLTLIDLAVELFSFHSSHLFTCPVRGAAPRQGPGAGSCTPTIQPSAS